MKQIGRKGLAKLRREKLLITLVTSATSFALASAEASEIISSFDSGTENWRSVMLGYPNPGDPPNVLGSFDPVWNATGGNLGGYISLPDPDGSGVTGNCQYWLAPSKFLGDRLLWFGGKLSVSLRNSGTGFGSFRQEDIILTGGGRTIVYDLGASPSQSVWSPFSVTLVEAGWRNSSYSGAPATKNDLTTVLASLDGIFIRGEYQLGPDIAQLDSVSMRTAPVPEPATLAALSLGALGLLRRRKLVKS